MQINNVRPRTTHLDRIGLYDGPTQLGFAELAANSYDLICYLRPVVVRFRDEVRRGP